jgi:hypothetical protein
MANRNEPEHGFDGEHARDTHRGGLGDNYARDGGWSGGGRADDVVREEQDVDEDDEHSIGKGRE